MKPENPNSLFFAMFNCYSKNDNLCNCLGYYSVQLLQEDERGNPCQPIIYGAWVHISYGRVTFVPDHGDPPSARAGAALDLHQAAAARVRQQARIMQKPVAFYIDDADRMAASSADSFFTGRAPAVLAASPVCARSGSLHRLAVMGAPLAAIAPAPPSM